MLESGIILTKKRISNNPHHTFGEVYIDDKIFTVKKSIYDDYQIGDIVEYSFTDHVSFSGVLFHNLNHINKIGCDSINADSTVITVKANQDEIRLIYDLIDELVSKANKTEKDRNNIDLLRIKLGQLRNG
jgi:hypothetical protein